MHLSMDNALLKAVLPLLLAAAVAPATAAPPPLYLFRWPSAVGVCWPQPAAHDGSCVPVRMLLAATMRTTHLAAALRAVCAVQEISQSR